MKKKYIEKSGSQTTYFSHSMEALRLFFYIIDFVCFNEDLLGSRVILRPDFFY